MRILSKTGKVFLSTLLLLTILLSSFVPGAALQASAVTDDFDNDRIMDYFVTYLPDGTIALESVNGGGSNPIIPEIYEGYIVSRIESSCFENVFWIESVVIGSNIKSIGSYAFYNCTSLKTVEISASVAAIGDYCFSGCPDLDMIIVNDNNPIYSDMKGLGVLYRKDNDSVVCCPQGKSGNLTIPSGAKVIDPLAFYWCQKLTSISIPESVVSIGSHSFSGCTNLKSVNIPDSVQLIPSHAFSECSSLKEIVIPSSVSRIGENAFAGCTSLQKIQIPASVSWIASNAFQNTKDVTVYCEKGSYVETFCRENSIKYVASGNAVPDTPAVQADFIRLNGNNRISTAINISKSDWGTSDFAVIANGFKYPDALSGAPLAHMLDAPILLTEGITPETDLLNELSRLGVKKIYILGGPSAIGDNYVAQLSRIYNVERLYGNTRYETSVAIAEKMETLCHTIDTAFIVSGENYPDALSASSFASYLSAPIIYSDKAGNLKSQVQDYLEGSSIKNYYIIGGTSAIGSSMDRKLERLSGRVSRLFGSNRYETSLSVAEVYLNRFGESAACCFATGTNYPDALAGSVFAARRFSPVILLDPTYGTTSTFNSKLSRLLENIGVEDYYVFGGENALSTRVVNAYLGSRVTPSPGIESICGYAFDYHSDKPIAGAQVVLLCYDDYSDEYVVQVTSSTSNNGKFTFRNWKLESGKEYKLEISAYGYYMGEFLFLGDDYISYDSQTDIGYFYIYSTQGTINGVIHDDGVPLSGIEVRLCDENGGPYRIATTDSDGFFFFQIDPGQYWLRFHGKYEPLNYLDIPVDIYEQTSITRDVDLQELQELERGYGNQLYGSVSLGSSPFAEVEAYSGNTLIRSCKTDSEGYYSMFLKPGRYTIRATIEDGSWHEKIVYIQTTNKLSEVRLTPIIQIIGEDIPVKGCISHDYNSLERMDIKLLAHDGETIQTMTLRESENPDLEFYFYAHAACEPFMLYVNTYYNNGTSGSYLSERFYVNDIVYGGDLLFEIKDGDLYMSRK